MTPHPRPVLVLGRRSHFARAVHGSLAAQRPDDILAQLISAHRCQFEPRWAALGGAPDDFMVGCAYPEGEQGYNIARTVALGARLDCPGVTLNRLCGSSLDAVRMAASLVRSDPSLRLMVGGIESMSRIQRRGATFSPSRSIELTCKSTYITMGETAERVATAFPHILRGHQEEYAAQSHERASSATKSGWLRSQILTEGTDESIRYPVDRAKMAQLAPTFDPNGSVTAATSSPLSDGAAIGWVVNEDLARNAGLQDGLEILGSYVAHVPPEHMGLGPIPAVRGLLRQADIAVSRVHAWEINEAFAVQALAVLQTLEINPATCNAWGGALAIGHPLGATGLRLLIQVHERLAREGADDALGVATLCIGGGQGLAILVRYRRWQ